jgi:hypothetical protein
MEKIVGLLALWVIGQIIAALFGPIGGPWVSGIVSVCLLAAMGSLILSLPFLLGGNGFDHLFAGISLAFPGWVLTLLVLHWQTVRYASGTMLGMMLHNFVIIGMGMAMVALLGVPLMLSVPAMFKKRAVKI